MADLRHIRTPLSQHWRRIRYQLVPVVLFCLAAGTVFWLWGRQTGRAFAVGEVQALRIDLTAPANGMLIAAGRDRWELFQPVDANDLLAEIDPWELKAELVTHQKRIIGLQKELAATDAKARTDLATFARDEASFELEKIQRIRRMDLDIEVLRLAILVRQGTLTADGLELSRLRERLAQIDKLVKDGVETLARHFDIQTRHDVLAKQIAGNDAALIEEKAQLEEAKRRAAAMKESLKLPTVLPVALETFLEPVRAAIAVEEAERDRINLEIESLKVRAPFDGMIRQIFRRPGQTVRRGEPILTIVSGQTQHVISYVRHYHLVKPKAKMPVEMRVRTLPIRMVKGTVEQVGPQVVRVPLQHLNDPQTVEWGLPVRIAIAEMGVLKPGEMVDITFRPNSAK